MVVNKDTQLCISISRFPGNTGTTIHNALYDKFKLNFLYKSFGIQEENLSDVVRSIRALNIRGCSVSMPFKNTICRYLDELSDSSNFLQSVNTVVNSKGMLKGYNTDVIGAHHCLSLLKEQCNFQNVVMFGCGATSRAILLALNELGQQCVTIVNRSESNFLLAKNLFKDEIHLSLIENTGCLKITEDTLLINATPVGMKSVDPMPFSNNIINHAAGIFDVVVLKSRLQKYCSENNVTFIGGEEMTIVQALSQFNLYTNLKIDASTHISFIRRLLEK